MNYPKKTIVRDITVRDGFQHEEKFIPTEAKIWVAEELILAGFQQIEITNLGNPKRMPQFSDANELLKALHTSKRISHLIDNVEITAVTIREKAIERAIAAKKDGFGPERILLMVSTSETHHKRNSGLPIEDYWKMSETYIQKAHDVGIKVNGTVSTIWGCPIEGPTEIKKAIEYSRHWLDIGADDVEHADHDGSASPNRVYDYFSMLLDAIPNPAKHVAHFHSTRGWGMANILAALLAGITQYESTMGGIGGQPANFVSGVPVKGTGAYYYPDPCLTGLVSTEDMLVMMDEMNIETGINIDRTLEIGSMVERIVGRKLRSETINTGRIPNAIKGVRRMNRYY